MLKKTPLKALSKASSKVAKKTPPLTPVRAGLTKESALHSAVKDGLGAVQSSHKDYFDLPIRQAFSDSMELDEAVKKGNEQDNRWDYLLGHGATNEIIAIEPHSAKQDEVSTVIKKRKSAKEHLKDHLREGVKINKWLWVASGKVHFANTEKVIVQLNQNGIKFVGTKIKEKDLL
jgi:hypothetical protein